MARRRTGWLARAGYLREADDGAEPELDGIARCFPLSLAGGTFLRLDADAALSDGARPSLSLERLSQRPGGRISRTRSRRQDDAAPPIASWSPPELMARLAALVPPPWHPLTRFHGVLASHQAWRAAVVPEKKTSSALPRDAAAEPAGQLALLLEGESKLETTVATATRHASTYLPGAELWARTFALDALRRPTCSGKLRVVEGVTDPRKARWWPGSPRPARRVPCEEGATRGSTAACFRSAAVTCAHVVP